MTLEITESLQKLVLQNAVQRARLPQELTDIVIDHLHNDKTSLIACSLVSHDWLWSARYHLFYDANITTFNEKRDLEAFLQAVTSSQLQLGNHVRCLRIRGAHDKTRDDFPSILKFLGAILPKLPSIRKIYLSQMVWGQTTLLPFEHPEPMPWELGLLSLKDIRLEASDAESLDIAQHHLSYLLHQFFSIRLLAVNTVRIGYRALYSAFNSSTTRLMQDASSDSGFHGGKCHISALNCFTEDDSFYLLPALSRLGLSRHIQTLKFGSGCPEITASAQAVANLAASSLRFVRYRVPSDDYGAYHDCSHLHLSGSKKYSPSLFSVL